MREEEFPPLTPHELSQVGQVLCGPAWRGLLAQALNVTEHEIVRVESGIAPAPSAWRGRIVVLAQERAHRALEAASTLLWQAANPGRADPELPRAVMRLAR